MNGDPFLSFSLSIYTKRKKMATSRKKTCRITSATNEGSVSLLHPWSLIRAFAAHLRLSWA